MPSRIVREEIITSETINSLSVHAELLYRRLLNLVDDYGRFDARANIVRLRAYPLQLDSIREADVTRWLAECRSAGAIVLYEVDGKPYLAIPKVQTPRSLKTKVPEPPAGIYCWRPPSKEKDPPYQGVLKIDANICAQLIASESIGLHVPASVPYSDSYSSSDSSSPLSPPRGARENRRGVRKRDAAEASIAANLSEDA